MNEVTVPPHCSFLGTQDDALVQAHDALRRAFDHMQSRLSELNRQRFLAALASLMGMAHQEREREMKTSLIMENVFSPERACGDR